MALAPYRQGPDERQRLLREVVSNSSWTQGRLAVQLHQPFDLILRPTPPRGIRKVEPENWRRWRDLSPLNVSR